METIADIMTKDVLSLKPSDTLEELVELLAGHKVSCVLVVFDDAPVGMVTERDLIRKVLLGPRGDWRKRKVKDIMTKNLITIRPERKLHQASEFMHDQGIRHLPVVDDYGKLVGIVSQTDIVKKTHDIQLRNSDFMTYQNIQTAVILLFFFFVIVVILWNYFS